MKEARVILGVALGVIAMILTANGLQWLGLVEWGAVLIGALVGLEVGFWVGAPAITLDVHRKIMRDADDAPAWWSFVKIVSAVGCVLFSVFATGWLHWQQVMFFANQKEFIENLGPALTITSGIMFLTYQGMFVRFVVAESYNEQRIEPFGWSQPWMRRWLFDDGVREFLFIALVLPLIISFGWIIGLPLVVLAMAVATVYYLYRGLLALSVLCANNQTSAITFGVLLGGGSGLSVAGFTGANFQLLTMECGSGVLLGGVATYSLIRLGYRLMKSSPVPVRK